MLPHRSFSSEDVQQIADHTHGREIVVYHCGFDHSLHFGDNSNWDKQAWDVIDKSVAAGITLASLLLGHYRYVGSATEVMIIARVDEVHVVRVISHATLS